MISEEFIGINRDIILNLWKQIGDRGADPQGARFEEWLLASDFFTAPCSTKFHLACRGGLAEHSLNVYSLLKEKVERYYALDTFPESSIIICGLAHDLCKVNYYKPDEEAPSSAQIKYLKDLATFDEYKQFDLEGTMTKAWASNLIGWIKDGRKGDRPTRDNAYIVDDQFPMGHGEKSVSILQDFFHLTDEEKLAIRYHMNAWESGPHFNYHSGQSLDKAVALYPLVILLATADQEATHIVEREEK